MILAWVARGPGSDSRVPPSLMQSFLYARIDFVNSMLHLGSTEIDHRGIPDAFGNIKKSNISNIQLHLWRAGTKINHMKEIQTDIAYALQASQLSPYPTDPSYKPTACSSKHRLENVLYIFVCSTLLVVPDRRGN